MLDPDMPAQQMRLHMGEVTAQEMRTARAAIRWANSAISTATPADVAGLVERLNEAADRVAKRAMGYSVRALVCIPRQSTDVDAIISEAATTLLSLSARCEEMGRALEPFAKAADNFDNTKIANAEEWFAYPGITSATENRGAITAGDLRRARTALSRRATGGE